MTWSIAPVINIPPGIWETQFIIFDKSYFNSFDLLLLFFTWKDILPKTFCSSPESGWNADLGRTEWSNYKKSIWTRNGLLTKCCKIESNHVPSYKKPTCPPQKINWRNAPLSSPFQGQNCLKFVLTAKIAPKNMEKVPTYKEPWLRPPAPWLCPQAPSPPDNRPPSRHNSDLTSICRWPSLVVWCFFLVLLHTSCLACIRLVVELSPLRGFDIQAKWRKRPAQLVNMGQNGNYTPPSFIQPVKVVWSQSGLSTSILAASPILMHTALLVCRYVDLRGKEGHRDLAQVTALASALPALLCLTTGAGVWQPVLLHFSPSLTQSSFVHSNATLSHCCNSVQALVSEK